jgi:hypothetical protein
VKFWLIVFLFDVNGEFQAKDIFETAGRVQCEQFAADYTKTIINTKMQAQFHCVSDDHYMGRKQDEGVDYDYIQVD